MGTIPLQKIPTEEDFARPKAAMRADFDLYAILREYLLNTFGKDAPLHDCRFFGRPNTGLHAYIFYRAESDILKYQENGIEQAIRESLQKKIESLPGLAGETIPVKFYFRSDEEVQKKFNGNYDRFFR